jgi:hypothetical protein
MPVVLLGTCLGFSLYSFLTSNVSSAYSLGAMRLLNFGVIIAFLLASTHMVVNHGGGPRNFVLIPHGDALPLHADDHHHEPSDSPASSHHDSDTHTHIEWYTTAAKSTITYQLIVSAIIDSSAWQTEVLFIAPPRFRVKAFTHPPRTFIYGLGALPSVCQSQPAASSSSRAANRPPRRMSSSGDPSSTI